MTSSGHHLAYNQPPQKGKFSGKSSEHLDASAWRGHSAFPFMIRWTELEIWSHIHKGRLENLVLLCA